MFLVAVEFVTMIFFFAGYMPSSLSLLLTLLQFHCGSRVRRNCELRYNRHIRLPRLLLYRVNLSSWIYNWLSMHESSHCLWRLLLVFSISPRIGTNVLMHRLAWLASFVLVCRQMYEDRYAVSRMQVQPEVRMSEPTGPQVTDAGTGLKY